jgi:hypothetical protein
MHYSIAVTTLMYSNFKKSRRIILPLMFTTALRPNTKMSSRYKFEPIVNVMIMEDTTELRKQLTFSIRFTMAVISLNHCHSVTIV